MRHGMYVKPWYDENGIKNNPINLADKVNPLFLLAYLISRTTALNQERGLEDVVNDYRHQNHSNTFGKKMALAGVTVAMPLTFIACSASASDNPQQETQQERDNLATTIYETSTPTLTPTPIPTPTVTPTPTPIRPTPTPNYKALPIEQLAEKYREALERNYNTIKDPEQKGRDEATLFTKQVLEAFYFGAKDEEDLIERMVITDSIDNKFFNANIPQERLLEIAITRAKEWMHPSKNRWDRDSRILDFLSGLERSFAEKLRNEK